MKIILMRHGESIGNIKHGFISGRTDPLGLTINGRAQVTRTAWELKDLSINYLYASPVVRAQETAHIMGSFLHQDVKTAEWLTELNHGIFEGNYWWEVIHKISPEWRKNRTQFHSAFPEGESMEMLSQRIWKGWQELIASHEEDSTILLVSHQAPISAIRYVVEQGDPAGISTPKKQADFLKHMSTVQLPNACFAEILLERNKITSTKEQKSFTYVEPSNTNILFYMKGIAGMSTHAKAEPLLTASSNIVYNVHDTEQYIVKVLENTATDAAKRQVKVYEYLGSNGVSVPQVKYFDTSKAFFKADVLVQDFVEGHVSTECIRDHGCGTFLNDIYETLHQVHSLPVAKVESFWRPPVEKPFLSWHHFMHYNINLTLHALPDFDLKEDMKSRLETDLSELRNYILEKKYPLVPIHGDPGSGNFIIGHDGGICHLRRIIDFEWARMGDALWDFAYYWGWLERDNYEISKQWKQILEQKLPEHLLRLNQFRLLFHSWTVRDMLDYKENPIRLRRGSKSLSLLY